MVYIIIAGPQAAGKTSTIRYFNSRYANVNSFLNRTRKTQLLKEGREVVGRKNKSLGAIFMTAEQERQVIEADLQRMTRIAENADGQDYIDESNIFTLAHAALHGVNTRSFFTDYCSALAKLNPGIIFFDIPPEVSFARRRQSYEERARQFGEHEAEKVMAEYMRYMGAVYPELLRLYEKIKFPKIKLNADCCFAESLQVKANALEGLLAKL